jgi:hypothetical protein
MATDPRTPNLIVIGAMNCGTSALHYYLDLHPEISMSSPKELDFFAGEPEVPEWMRVGGEVEEKIIASTAGNWSKGADWYLGHFDASVPVKGEASPACTYPWHPRAAQRLAELAPDARLVFLVRDPLEQVVSQYVMHRGASVEPRPIEEALSDPCGVYGARAHYARCVESYYEAFGADRILVRSQEELLANRRAVMAEIFEFASADPSFWDERMERERHATAGHGRRRRVFARLKESWLGPLGTKLPAEWRYRIEQAFSSGGGDRRPRLPDELRARWREALAPDAARLRKLAGERFEGWSV